MGTEFHSGKMEMFWHGRIRGRTEVARNWTQRNGSRGRCSAGVITAHSSLGATCSALFRFCR